MQPTATPTFLFTDIEGSTRLWERHPETMRIALGRHDEILRAAIQENGGHVFKTVGDAFCAVFDAPTSALRAAVSVQTRLGEGDWPHTGPLRVRMAIHSGAVQHRDDDYFGPTLNRVARLLSVGHGGQVLVSQSIRDQMIDGAGDGIGILDMASHRLKDLGQPEHIWQVTHPNLGLSFPPLHTLQAFANNLPVQVSSFVGREHEMAAVKDLLGNHRLVTLTGPGGCGKTRLALQTAAEIVESYGDGVWLVELAAITDPVQVVQAAATALGLRESPDRTLEMSLVDHLATRKMLLIFDNCEHLIEESARLVEHLLGGCPNLRVLATSREPLDIAGERSWTIPSMPQPKPSDTPTDADPTPALLQFDSVRLFVERASETGSTFVFGPRNATAVSSICRRLDGIPLAIELAAATTRSLNPGQISDRLDDRFRLLTGGRRTASERQKTLRGMIDWSYELLTEQERGLLTRLSIFSGGWTLEAAEAVCSGDGIDERDIFDLLNRLVTKSLVVAHDLDGHFRYGLLETIRQYSEEKLAAGADGPRVGLHRRHVDWCVAFAKQSTTEARGPGKAVALTRMESEHDNARSALAWCLTRAELGQEALEMVSNFCMFWYSRGYSSEGLRLTIAALDHPGASDENSQRASALNSAGILHTSKGDFLQSRAYLEAGLAIRRELGDASLLSTSLNNLVVLEARQGNYVLAEAYSLESLALSRASGNLFNVGNGCNNLGNISKSQAKYEDANRYYLECLKISREIGSRSMTAIALCNLGCIELDNGRFEPAIQLFKEGSGINRELEDDRQVAANLPDLASAYLESGNIDEAAHVAAEACRLAETVQDAWHHACAEHVRACVELARGEVNSAKRICEECLSAFVEIGDWELVAKDLLTLAEVACASEQFARASTLIAALDPIRTSIHSPMPPRERSHANRVIAASKIAIGDEMFELASRRGLAMNRDELIEYAVSNKD